MFVAVLLGILFIFLYVSIQKILWLTYYWEKREVFHIKPWLRFIKIFFNTKPIVVSIKESYEKFPDRRYYGSYQFFKPSLLVRDINLIKQITIKDFDHFPDHFGISNEKTDPLLSQNLFSLKGEKWRDMRTTLSPTFTSNKMRAMFTLMEEAANNFTNHFLNDKNNNDIMEMEMKEIFSRFTNDVIATCAFGIQCDSLKDKTNDFFTMGRTLTQVRGWVALKGLFYVIFPSFFELLRIPLFPSQITNFFKNIVIETIENREMNHIVRPDMIHLLMEARNGRLNYDQIDMDEFHKGRKMPITNDLITAQALVFFLAGFETSSNLMSFMAHELAENPDIQKKLQDEIDYVLERTSGEISYDDILKMKYMDQVISETLRKYPPGFVLNRECTKDYVIPAVQPNEKTVTIERGCLIAIPVYGIHMDPMYFPNPEKFDPDRFGEDNKIIPGTYLPFGIGPRNCIGFRFALLECKVLMFRMLSKFDVVVTKKTVIPLQLSPSISMGSKYGFWLGLQRRNLPKCE